MRLSTRLTVALGVAGLLLFSGYGLYAVESEWDELERSAWQDLELLSRGLEPGVEAALREGQLREIDATLRQLHGLGSEAPGLGVLVVDRAGRILSSTPGSGVFDAVAQQALQRALERGEAVRGEEHDRRPSRLVLVRPLPSQQRGGAEAIILVRGLDDLHQELSALRRDLALSALLFAATVLVVGRILGSMYVDSPMGQLLAAMRRVRSGNLALGLPEDQDEEIAAVAVEFNRMVAELRHTRQALEEAAEQRRALERALQQADKLATIGQLSAGLAHEIGSPLQVLHGRARALINRAEDAEQVRRTAGILVDQTERITRIVEQLLRFARSRPPRMESIDPAAAVEDVVDLMRLEAQRRGIRLEADTRGAPAVLRADADQVQQVLLNLIKNAMGACVAGGEIRVRLRPAEGEPGVRIEVEDDGAGVPEELRGRLFEPFFTTRGSEGGTGLGLAVVQAIVREHGGRIEAQAREQGGTRFVVNLPGEEGLA